MGVRPRKGGSQREVGVATKGLQEECGDGTVLRLDCIEVHIPSVIL